MSPEKLRELDALLFADETQWSPHKPTPRQQLFLDLDCEEAFFGGAAGGSKSETLLMAALQYVDVPNYAAIVFRRTYTDLTLPDALLDRARRWLTGTAARWIDKEKTWRFPSGATLTFAYLEAENDKYRYQGSAYQGIFFDELTQFTETQYLYLFSRLRRLAGVDVPLRMRSASNPGGIGSAWVQGRFIPEGFTPEMAGELKYFTKVGDDGIGRVFLPARLRDNPYLDRESYEKSLENLDPVTRAQLLEGDWQIRERGNVYPMWEDGVLGRHVITWSQFASVYGVRHIPTHWLGAHGHDPGFDPDPRAAVWNFMAGANGPLAGDVFCIRELYANRMTVDDFADEVKQLEAPYAEAARIQKRIIGHEASSEQATLLQKHHLNYQKNKPDANGGIAQLRHYLRITDHDKPHPFKPQLFGRPHFYLVVADDQLVNPKNEEGMVNFRAEMAAYRYIDGSPTQGRGMPKIVPYDFFNHLMDAQRGIAVKWFAGIAPLTAKEEQELLFPEELREDVISTLPAEQQGRAVQARTHWLSEFESDKRKDEDDVGFYLDD